MDGLLVLADGETFEGRVDSPATATGEVVFNTVHSGYQEVITDPSYAGQIVCFTYPHIGNYGVTPADDQSGRPRCRGVIAREVTERPSNRRAAEAVRPWLARHGVPVLTGIDTRRLTRHLREAGSLCGAFGPADEHDALLAAARAEPGTEGADLVSGVTTREPYRVGDGPLRVVAYDLGIKQDMLRRLGRIATVDVVPAGTPAGDVLARRPDGVFLSNGPGDPAAVDVDVAGLLGRVPLFGVCLGHQLLARALGARTYKLPFGHHGGNHPVRRVATGQVEVTSQNHNYAVSADGLSGARTTHVNLNDGVVEGLECRDARAFSVQYHPEAAPGPHDAGYLFEEFRTMMEHA
ncbi:glutamine-hydrolyzing carbamoyl-phosphate synthase small subunit [Actinomadura opuntiae]|uniref:glutamine-hydrolyzing carbamoyl-phosphate synthase small subunit n=1 Tax=Actinomadura sp. OS1-43 TaxID=604315 RepID=UPI00255AF42E|nr:glutamine-hydrolyzing carbamoyl-phosphate synthase small subunit [Actinomadura sp. OS1-43]MDL4815198.1 glutamine-hydrolyzing carbamoyl-phosphate synthase small subunit [Actinomadura sp. OS1-43]